MADPRGPLGRLFSALSGAPPESKRVVRDARDRLHAAFEDHLADADPETRRVATAIAGLLACTAYADGVFTDDEERAVRDELGRLHGMHPRAVDAIAGVLRADARALAAQGDQEWARVIRDASDRELALEVLEVLVEIAAADGELSLSETNYLRRLTPTLGLTQADYDAFQARHVDKLGILR